MACLLAELEDHPKQVSQECRKLLDKRKQLWELAAQVCLPVEIKTLKWIYFINLEFLNLMKDHNMYMYMHSWGEYTVLQELMNIEDFFVPFTFI